MSTQNIYALTDTWNAGGTTFTAIKMDVLDTASAAGSLLIDLQTGGVSQFSVTKAGAITSKTFALSGQSLTGSQADNLVNLAATWNTTGTPTAIKLNVTDTASNASSLLMDLQQSGTSRLTLSKTGVLTRNPGNFETVIENARIVVKTPSGQTTGLNISQTGITAIVFNNIATTGIGAFTGTNIYEFRDGTTAQNIRIYRTHTATDNFQRLAITSASTTLTGMSGASVTATNLIPAGAVVVGVTTRVSTAITGASGYQVGTALDADRWADKTGTAVGTTTDNRDWTAGTIECFTAATSVIITAKTANFTDGAMLVTVHYLAGEAD